MFRKVVFLSQFQLRFLVCMITSRIGVETGIFSSILQKNVFATVTLAMLLLLLTQKYTRSKAICNIAYLTCRQVQSQKRTEIMSMVLCNQDQKMIEYMRFKQYSRTLTCLITMGESRALKVSAWSAKGPGKPRNTAFALR